MKKQDKPLPEEPKLDGPKPDKTKPSTPTRPDKKPSKEPGYAPQQPDINRPDIGTPTNIPPRALK